MSRAAVASGSSKRRWCLNPHISGTTEAPGRLIRPSLCVKSRTCVNGCASACSAAKRSPQNPPTNLLLRLCSQRISTRSNPPRRWPRREAGKRKPRPHLRRYRNLGQRTERARLLKSKHRSRNRPSNNRQKNARRKTTRLKKDRPKNVPRLGHLPLYRLQAPAADAVVAEGAGEVAADANRQLLKLLHLPQ
jgi:hypothetical protein